VKEATVKLKHKKKNRIITVSMHEYATDLGKDKFRAYALVNNNNTGAKAEKIEVKTQPEDQKAGADAYTEIQDLNNAEASDEEQKAEEPSTLQRTSSKKSTRRTR